MKQILQGFLALLVAVTAVSQTSSNQSKQTSSRGTASNGALLLSSAPNHGQPSSQAPQAAHSIVRPRDAVATGTLLTASAASVAYQTPITLTANVSGVDDEIVSPGQVIFCSASATNCNTVQNLGIAQLNSSGNAVLKLGGAGTIGSHSFKAVFIGTAAYEASTSTAQTVTVTGSYPTSTTIASMGSAGVYSLTGTVVGLGTRSVGPTGTVSFLDTSNSNVSLGSGTLGAATLGFGLAQPIGSPVAVGSGAYGVATGDFNGDGFQDVVVENYYADTVSVLLGKGDGTFQQQVTYAVGVEPERVLVADLNGDGFPDLIVANSGSGTIGVLLGNGDGTFRAQVTYAASGTPVGLAVMDINHDGYPDIVAGDYYENQMAVLLGNGDGTLKAVVTYPTGRTPQTVAEGDFNGDGNVDVVVGNLNGGTAGVFLGNGDGTFQAMVTYAVGSQPQGVQVGDFNEDGKQDLAVSNSGGNTVSILLGNGDGTFQTQVTYAVGADPVGLVIADFNGDGHQDLSVGNTAQSALTQSVLLGNGDGTFQTQVTFPAGNFPYGEAVADFNGDGLPDMAVAEFNDATATIFLSQVTQTATATANVTIGGSSDSTHNVEASYPGDTNFVASVSQTTELNGGGATTVSSITALSVTPAAPNVGQSVTFSVTVAGTTQVTPVPTVPTGTVTLMNTAVTPAAVLGTITLSATGAGTFSTTALPKGSYSVTAAYSGDTNYQASTSPAQSFVVSLASQTITFPSIPNHKVGDAPFALSATASSGLAVSYAVTTGPATVAGSTVTLTGAGAVTIQASQAGNADYAAATPVSQSFTVSGAVAPTLTSLLPTSAVAGAGATTLTLAGTNFAATDLVQAGGTALTTTFVNATSLTAVIPANLLVNAGTLAISVTDTATSEISGTVSFVVAAAPVVVFSGPPTAASGQQPMVTFELKQPYAVPINCMLTLTFTPSDATGTVDPAVQFSTGGTTVTFTVPAGSTTTPPVAFQTGTVAGAVTVTLTILTADGADITPAYIVPVVVSLPATVPQLSTSSVNRAAAGNASMLTVTIQGFSNTQEVKTAVFHFTPVPGNTLTDPDVTVDVTDIFVTWFGSAVSTPYGSTFTYTQPFNLNADPKTIQSVTVALVNGVGSSVEQIAE